MIASAVLVAAIPLFAWFGVRFHARQNAGAPRQAVAFGDANAGAGGKAPPRPRRALGGAMSRAKAFWLPFAVYFWFVVCAVVAVDGIVATPFRIALGALAASMWIRGCAEMVMLYVTKNWRPPFGVAHDFVSLVVVVAALALQSSAVVDAITTSACSSSIDRWTFALCVAVIVSLVVEMHHAWSFHAAVRGRTTGDDGVWFADEHAEHFRSINRNTRRWNVVLGLVVGAYVLRYVSERIFA